MGLTINSMRPLKIVCLIFIVSLVSRIAECSCFLVNKVYVTTIVISDSVLRLYINVIAAVGIYISCQLDIKIIIQHLVVTNSVKPQSILGTYIKSGRKKSRMSAL